MFKKMKELLTIGLVMAAAILQAQDWSITPASDKHFTHDEMRALIKKSAFDLVRTYDVPLEIFDFNYALIERELLRPGPGALWRMRDAARQSAFPTAQPW